MGVGPSSGCCGAATLMVHVPCGGSDLAAWDRTGQDNVFQCLEYLERLRLEDLRHGRGTGWRLAANYDVEVVKPRSGRASTVQVANVGQELHTVYTTLRKEKRKGKRFKPLLDVRREAVLCAVHSSLLKRAGIHLMEGLSTDFLNSQFEVPFTVHQVRCRRRAAWYSRMLQCHGAVAPDRSPVVVPVPSGWQCETCSRRSTRHTRV